MHLSVERPQSTPSPRTYFPRASAGSVRSGRSPAALLEASVLGHSRPAATQEGQDGAEAPNQAATAAGPVFLSYASQNADAARRICDALRAAGIEVWFDQSELRGGDAWDRSIRKHIKACVLFILIISRNTHERDEAAFPQTRRSSRGRTV